MSLSTNKKILRLTLSKQWFDLIEKGIKTEEYREVKRYWIQRLCNEVEWEMDSSWEAVYKKFDFVQFTNGYNKKSPQITLQFLGLRLGKGNPDWGAMPKTDYFVIELGREVGRQNC